MYFSLIRPRPHAEREAAIQWAKGPYEQHQWIWKFLPSERGSQRDFLFRQHAGNPSGFYVVSSNQPVAMSDAWQVDSREYNPQILVGQRLAFELRANPVITQKIDEKKKRNDVVMSEKKKILEKKGFKRWADWQDSDPEKPLLYDFTQRVCALWLESRSERAGFSLIRKNAIRVDGYSQKRAFKKDIRFSTVDFSGILEVRNPDIFRQTLFKGLGAAKAFGCGLMLVKKV